MGLRSELVDMPGVRRVGMNLPKGRDVRASREGEVYPPEQARKE
jgi:hypothetical protein